jgi:hypothetical protein
MVKTWIYEMTVGSSTAGFLIREACVRYALLYKNEAVPQEESLLGFYESPEEAIAALMSGVPFSSVMLYVGVDGLTIPEIKDTSVLGISSDLADWQIIAE